MNSHGQSDDNKKPSGFQQRAIMIIDRACSKMGASRRQFGIFALLLAVACTFWARPAGMLIWHRLRIVTGMPRMAVANEDPALLAQVEVDAPELLDAGREVHLDEKLLRDPFRTDSLGDGGGFVPPNDSTDTDLDHEARLHLITGRASQIRLSGTSRGLGSAVLDGRVSIIDAELKTPDLHYRLVEVRSGSVVIEACLPGDEQWFSFLLDREGAVPVRED